MAEQVVSRNTLRIAFHRTREKLGGLDDRTLDEAVAIVATAHGVSEEAVRDAVASVDPAPGQTARIAAFCRQMVEHGQPEDQAHRQAAALFGVTESVVAAAVKFAAEDEGFSHG